MRRIRKGFTIIELVITIAILGVSTALTAVVISSATKVQQSTATQYEYNNTVNGIDSLLRDYVSFISVNDEKSSFTFFSCTDDKISFKHGGYEYYLSYEFNSFVFSTDYNGEDDYFKKNITLDVSYVDDVVFSYYSDTALLTLSLTVNGLENNFYYVVRSLL